MSLVVPDFTISLCAAVHVNSLFFISFSLLFFTDFSMFPKQEGMPRNRYERSKERMRQTKREFTWTARHQESVKSGTNRRTTVITGAHGSQSKYGWFRPWSLCTYKIWNLSVDVYKNELISILKLLRTLPLVPGTPQ